MDNTDYKIIEILQEEGRISMKDLGKIVGLTSPAVSERVRRLEEAGVIEGYKAIVNPNALGRVIKAFVHVSLPSNKYNEFLEAARKDSRIVECHHIYLQRLSRSVGCLFVSVGFLCCTKAFD